MTMIELVASLALLIMILGVLLTVMNTATSLWSSSRTQQPEQAVGQNILDLLADDLQHAVTDNATTSNGIPSAPPTFMLDARTNQTSTGVQVVLQFARHAKRRTSPNTTAGIPLSLDAVFYTYVDYALYRHVIPLSYGPTLTDTQPLGELLDAQRANVDDKALHAEILAYVKNPESHSAPGALWSYTLLAERIDLLNLQAALPEAYARKSDSTQIPQNQQGASGLPLTPEYDYLKTDVLPNQIDVALRLNSEEDWATLQRLQTSTAEESAQLMKRLGLLFSTRICFPAQGGSRLP